MSLFASAIATNIARMVVHGANPAAAKAAASHRQSWAHRLGALFPNAAQVAWGTVIGALALVVTNAIAIAVVLGWPANGWLVRLQHHGFDALYLLGFGGLLAAPATLVAHLGGRGFGRIRLPSWLGWLGLAILSSMAMQWVLGRHLDRQAAAVLGGRYAYLLYPLYVGLCGLAIPVAYAVGGICAQHRFSVGVALVAALAGVVVAHVILRDDYPGVHTAILWTCMCLLGTALASRVRRVVRWRRWRQAGAVFIGFCALSSLCWAPPNTVRLELFREPGAVVPWILSRTVWSLPDLPTVPPEQYAALEAKMSRRFPSVSPRGSYASEPVVVLLTVEALRADVVADRANDDQLPQLAKLRDTGSYFERANTAGSQTSVSLTAMFAGRYYSQLLWRKYGQGKKRFYYPAEDPAVRFPQLLSDAGVHTFSYLGLIFLADRFGIARGFTDEKMVVQGRAHGSARDIMNPLLGQLRRTGKGKHFFYAHLMEPHEPYDRGALKEGTPWDCYVSEVAVVDRWLKKLVTLFRRRFPRRGYLIITGDHGEAFGEHGTRFHTKTLYEELLQVPLIIWGPGIPERKISERVGLIDLGPTILQLYGLPVTPQFMGQSLLPLMEGQVSQLERPLLAEGRLRRALYRRAGLKVIEDTRRKVVEVYDLQSDPEEARNLFSATSEPAQRAVAALRAFFARHTRRQPPGYVPPFKP